MEKLGLLHDAEEWRLSIDASKLSLKAVLLHNGMVKPSILVAHSVAKRESYESMSLLLNANNYKKHCLQIRGDLKVTAFLLGLQTRYMNYCCFLCLWAGEQPKNITL
jgi:hypothetical protein